MQNDWLLAVGCSLTWGSEITLPRESLEEDKLLSWPAKLGELISCKNVINCGYPGRSNGSIFRTAMEEISKCYETYGSNGLVVIQWTGLHRIEIINPFQFDIKEFYKKEIGVNHHPGQEGSYLCITPNELSNKHIQELFPGLANYYIYNWAYAFYQTELLITYSLAITSFAKSLGIKVFQFNGIDELLANEIPDHAISMSKLIGKEYFHPYDRNFAFWPSKVHFPRTHKKNDSFVFNKEELVMVPPHPTAEQHKQWAEQIYSYITENELI